ncbi:hypothetical protein [Labrys neptuniae]
MAETLFDQLKRGAIDAARATGTDPRDILTVVSYETGGTFDPWKKGPTTQWGQHRGLIQWGEPQREKYGITPNMSAYDQMIGVGKYLKNNGVKPGDGLLPIYAAVNAGDATKIHASDANNGGAPGTVLDKVRDQMGGHKANASAILGGSYTGPAYPRQSTSFSTDPSVSSTQTPDYGSPTPWGSSSIQPAQPITMGEEYANRQRQRLDANPYNPAQAVGQGLYEANSYWFHRQPWMLPDPQWKPTADTFKAARDGIPESYWHALEGAASQAQLDQRRDNILEALAVDKRFGDMGWSGAAIRMGTSLTDAPALASMFLAPEVGIPARAGFLARVAARSAEAAAINTAWEVPHYATNPLADKSDFLWAAGSGLALGATFGALSRNKAVAPEADKLQGIGRHLMDTAEREAAGLPINPTGSTAGAAQASPADYLRASTADWMHSFVDEAVPRSWAPMLRWDIAGKGKSSDNPLTRAFTSGTVVDVVPNADKSKVIQHTAEEFQATIHKDATMPIYQAHQENFGKYLERNQPGKGEDVGDVEKRFREQVTEYVYTKNPMAGEQFDPSVRAMGDKLRKAYGNYVDIAQDPGIVDGAARKPMHGAENLQKDANYTPNMTDHAKVDAHEMEFGTKTMETGIAKLFEMRNPDLPEGLAAKMAKGYWATMRDTAGGLSKLETVIGTGDLDGLERTLRDIKGVEFSDDEITSILDSVRKPPNETAGVSRLKRRAPYDNETSIKLVNQAGEVKDFRMADLFRNDYLEAYEAYSRSMSGNIAMSMVRIENPLYHALDNPDVPRYLIDGIHSQSAMDKLKDEMRAVWHAKKELPFDKRKAYAERDAKRMQFMYDKVRGVPDEFNSTVAGRSLRLAQSFNFARVMNMVGVSAVAEGMTVFTQFGLKASLQGMPAFKAMMRDAKTGLLKNEHAREMEALFAPGAQHYMDTFKNFADADGLTINRSAGNKFFNKADEVAHTMTNFTSKWSGLKVVDGYSRMWAASAQLQQIANAVAKSKAGKITGVNMDRMRSLGLSDAMTERVFEQVRQFGRKDGGSTAMNLDKWADREAAAALRLATWRSSRLAIQENFMGQGAPWLSHWMGRVIFQFRGFMLGAHSAQFLRNLHMRDFAGFATWMASAVTGGMAYMAQTHLTATGRSDREKFLKERLSGEKLAEAMFQRASWSSIMPNMFDTALVAAGRKPAFDTRSSGTGSAFFSSPTLDLIDAVPKALGGIARGATGQGFTQVDARNVARLVPFQNMAPAIPLLNTLISDLPENRSHR